MSSGYGWNGGQSRCFSYWQKFQKCYAESENPSECSLFANNYAECLHHPQELKRAQVIQAELHRKLEHEVKESKKRAEILSSGGVAAAVSVIEKA